MIAKLFRWIAIFVLVILPYFPVTENFFPPEFQIDHANFALYISLCLGLIFFGLLLLYFLKPQSNCKAGFLLIAIGLISIIPLHLGAPRLDASLIPFKSIEQLRYGLLLFVSILFFIAGFLIIRPINSPKLIVICVILCCMFLLNLWDNISSFTLSNDMESWIAKGEKAEEFIFKHDFKIIWRTFARISLYLSTIALLFPLFQKSSNKKWQLVSIGIFCLIGIVFCILCWSSDFQRYYLPFMIPAIALAPAYWLGLAITLRKKTTKKYKTNADIISQTKLD